MPTHPLKRFLFAAATIAAMANAGFAMGACAPDDVLYIAVEPVREPLGLRDETRAQYLQRAYGDWSDDRNDVIRFTPPPPESEDVVHVGILAPEGTVLERADVIVESRIEFVDASGRRAERVGHRELGRYVLQSDALNEISVPRAVLREPGSVLVVVTARAGQDQRRVFAGATPVSLDACPRRIYTHDRFTAIRLNRAKP